MEPTSPAPSADRLSVSFAMENIVVENEEEEQDGDKGPLSTILGFQYSFHSSTLSIIISLKL